MPRKSQRRLTSLSLKLVLTLSLSSIVSISALTARTVHA
ncbi:MAG: hypothetical protein QOJ76_154, partial [Acidobacteriota bacterium]|nr:hypothetical protein [Acidobacteriota bacterium]